MIAARVRRLLDLLSLLQGGRGHNVRALAEHCKVSRRTIFRDLDLLRQAGVPLVFDEKEQRYEIRGDCFLPPTHFTANEALALLVLCQELGGRSGIPFYGPARQAALKLESVLPAQLRESLRGLTEAVKIHLPPLNPQPENQQTYEQLLEAISRQQCVRISYDSLSEEATISTKLKPYRILFSRRSWYVIGRSSLHRAVRTFNVSRVTQCEFVEEQYEIPPRFSLDAYLRNAWHLIPEPGPDSEVVIRFDPLVARNVAEVLWHKTQHCAFHPDGTLDFRVTVSGLNEISWWVLGYGDQAEVLQPSALRALLSARCARMAERYAPAMISVNGASIHSQQRVPMTNSQ